MNIPTVVLKQVVFERLPVAEVWESLGHHAKFKSKTGQWILLGDERFPDGAVIEIGHVAPGPAGKESWQPNPLFAAQESGIYLPREVRW